MKDNQTTLLLKLAKELKKREFSKEVTMASLHAAGILTKKGNFTKKFPHLKRVVTIAK